MRQLFRTFAAFLLVFAFVGTYAQAGPIFITGHDPDFHAQSSDGAQDFLATALGYVTNGTLNDDIHKFLWVESSIGPFGGHLTGYNSLPLIGLGAGDYDVVDAAGLATADLSNYSAIAVASTFGGMLTSAELNELIARKADIAAFVNAGGGLFASAECEAGFSGCDSGATLTAPHGALFSFLPVSASSVATTPPYTLSSFGQTFGFSAEAQGYINECCTHNSFGPVTGLNIVDSDAAGHPTTYAGNVRIGDDVFIPPTTVPEPGTLTLLGLGLAGSVRSRLKKRRS